MNERIKDLALEVIVENIASEAWVFTNAELDKFAELIVRECVVMTKGYEFALGRKDELSKTMREHFGVEE